MVDTLTRQRARFIYEKTSAWNGDTLAKDALARVKGLPVQVRAQGLGTAVALLLREEKKDASELAELIAKWLFVNRDGPYKKPGWLTRPQKRREIAEDLLVATIEAPTLDYLAAQAEALAFLDQLKLVLEALTP